MVTAHNTTQHGTVVKHYSLSLQFPSYPIHVHHGLDGGCTAHSTTQHGTAVKHNPDTTLYPSNFRYILRMSIMGSMVTALHTA